MSELVLACGTNDNILKCVANILRIVSTVVPAENRSFSSSDFEKLFFGLGAMRIVSRLPQSVAYYYLLLFSLLYSKLKYNKFHKRCH
jgi:hypothetical protein